MRTSLYSAIVAALALGAANSAFADCAADATIADTQQSFSRAQKMEAAGNLNAAFHNYVAAQAYTCDPNPVELEAARRAAPLALQLGGEAEKKRDFGRAFELYDQGGQYAAADRALLAWIRANPDDPSVFGRAREATGYRALPAFTSNNKIRLGVTGSYRMDPALQAEVLAMPQKGFDRAMQKEMATFNEDFLKYLVQRSQTRPDDLADMAALQSWGKTQEALAQKWIAKGGDPIKLSRDSLGLADTWARATYDQALSTKLMSQLDHRQESRAHLLTTSYAGAPELLDTAINYQMNVRLIDDAARRSRTDAIRTQAGQLGDAANAKQRYGLAADYYRVAKQDAKAVEAQDKQQKLAMAKMQPQIDQAKQHAERMKAEYSDPAKVEAMKEQARKMQQSIQQQQQANAKSNAKKADDLEKELGM